MVWSVADAVADADAQAANQAQAEIKQWCCLHWHCTHALQIEQVRVAEIRGVKVLLHQ